MLERIFLLARMRSGTASLILPLSKWRARRDPNFHANLFIYREFFVKIWTGGQSRGRAVGCLWICLGVLRPNPRATGQIESRPRNQLSDWLLIKIAKFAQLAALCLPGIATEQLSERFPLSY